MSSQNLIQPGRTGRDHRQHAAVLYRGLPARKPSSIMVRSAPKSVSNTLSKPRRCSAVAILPVTARAHRHAEFLAQRGAHGGCGLHDYVLRRDRCMASHTLAVSSFSVSAPVGHTSMHWPQLMHGERTQRVIATRSCINAVEAAVHHADSADVLHLVAHGDAAAAQYALARVAYEGGRGIVHLVIGTAAGEARLHCPRRTQGTSPAARRWWSARRTGTCGRGCSKAARGSSCARRARRGCWS